MRIRLSTRLILSVVLIEVVMLSILVWNSVRLIGSSHSELLERSISEETTLLVNALAPGLMADDVAMIRDSLSLLTGKRGLAYVDVHDRTGIVVASLGEKELLHYKSGLVAGAEQEMQVQDPAAKHVIGGEDGPLAIKPDTTYEDAEADGLFDVVRDIEFYGQNLGSLHIGYSIDFVGQLTEKTRRQNTIIAAIELVLSILVTIFLGLVLTRGLRRLEEGARAFGGGELDHRIEIDSNDEIGDVARSFNKMAIDLSKNQMALEHQNRTLIDQTHELTQYRDHLEELVTERNRELRDAQDELVRKERLATLGQLSATVSHELRNPLGAMRPSLYILKKYFGENPDERILKAYDRIDRNIDRCDLIIDELLDFTRITSLERENTPIDEWLDSVIEEMDISKDIPVEKDLSLQGLVYRIDRNRLLRAIINVVDNACQAMQGQSGELRKGSQLCIKTREKGERVEIVITDTGAGMSKAVLAKIFEPLFSTKGFGVGLGMPTVKQIMEQHEGGIEIDTVEGKGTTVTLWLPQGRDEDVVAYSGDKDKGSAVDQEDRT